MGMKTQPIAYPEEDLSRASAIAKKAGVSLADVIRSSVKDGLDTTEKRFARKKQKDSELPVMVSDSPKWPEGWTATDEAIIEAVNASREP